MKTIDKNTIIMRRSNMVFSDIENEIVMMSLDNGEYYGLNRTASEIWNIIEQPLSISDICNKLILKFDVSYSECLHSVINLTGKFIDKKIIKIIE